MPGIQGMQHGLDRAEHADQGRSRLLPHAGDAGQPVAGIAAERGEGRVAAAGNAIAARHGRLVDDLQLGQAAGGIDDPHRPRVINQLEQVTIAGDDLNRAGLARSQRPDDVVGLVAAGRRHRHPGRGQHFLDHRDLGGQRVGGLLGAVRIGPVCLVGGDRGHPEGGPPVSVHARDEAVRAACPQQPGHHVQQAAHGIDRHAIRSGHGFRDSVERSVVQRGGVQEQQGSHPGHPAADRGRAAPERRSGRLLACRGRSSQGAASDPYISSMDV